MMKQISSDINKTLVIRTRARTHRTKSRTSGVRVGVTRGGN